MPMALAAQVEEHRPDAVNASERLIVALDLPTVAENEALAERLIGVVSFFKIGLRLHLAPGLDTFIDRLIEKGNRVFVDFKYNDVPQTVENAVEQAARRGITFVTVHGNGGAIRAAVTGRGNHSLPKIFVVTVLTSLDADDIHDLGFPCSIEKLVLHRAQQALKAGADGVIASGQETELIRQLVKDELLIVAPGIRLEDTSTDDHKRAVTPGHAVTAGADYLVVGRPIYEDLNPRTVAEKIIAEMQSAFDSL